MASFKQQQYHTAIIRPTFDTGTGRCGSCSSTADDGAATRARAATPFCSAATPIPASTPGPPRVEIESPAGCLLSAAATRGGAFSCSSSSAPALPKSKYCGASKS